MLIHKKTLGVLTTVAACYGSVVGEITATVDNLRRLGIRIDACDWWFVPNGSPLARRISLCYPDFTPVLDEAGELRDIVDLRAWRLKARRRQREAEETARRRADATARGYCGAAGRTRAVPGALAPLGDALRQRMREG